MSLTRMVAFVTQCFEVCVLLKTSTMVLISQALKLFFW